MTNTQAVPQGQAPEGTEPQPQAGNSNGQAPNEPQSQNSLDALQQQIAELRRENAAHRRKNKEQEDAAQQAEQARLAEQGEFKKLAEQHEAKVKELEPVAQSYQALSAQIHAQIEADIKDWPVEVKSLVPDASTAAESRLEQITRLRPLLSKLQEQARGQMPGNGPNPRPTQGTPDTVRDGYVKQLRSSGKYGA